MDLPGLQKGLKPNPTQNPTQTIKMGLKIAKSVIRILFDCDCLLTVQDAQNLNTYY